MLLDHELCGSGTSAIVAARLSFNEHVNQSWQLALTLCYGCWWIDASSILHDFAALYVSISINQDWCRGTGLLLCPFLQL